MPKARDYPDWISAIREDIEHYSKEYFSFVSLSVVFYHIYSIL